MRKLFRFVLNLFKFKAKKAEAMEASESSVPTKEEIIKDLKERLSLGIIDKLKVDFLIKLIEKAENDKEAFDIAAMGTTYKKTGLYFTYKIEKMGQDIRYLKRNEALSFLNDPQRLTHKLIIGDNYDALQNLLISHRGKVDVIYIDPPYGKDSMGAFAATNYDNAKSRNHLLSMLYPRLMLAKQLLSDKGVIFCSIDDRNQAYVKCLFDEVFFERNVETMIWHKMSDVGTAGIGKMKITHRFRIDHEYIIVAYTDKSDILFNLSAQEIPHLFRWWDELRN